MHVCWKTFFQPSGVTSQDDSSVRACACVCTFFFLNFFFQRSGVTCSDDSSERRCTSAYGLTQVVRIPVCHSCKSVLHKEEKIQGLTLTEC